MRRRRRRRRRRRMKGQVLYLGRIGGKSTGNGEATMKEDRQDRLQRVSIKKYYKPPCSVM